MKTSEFKKRVEEMGYCAYVFDYFISVKHRFTTEEVACINKQYSDSLTLKVNDIELAKLCIEYAETPIHEREEEKKYTVELPNPAGYYTHSLFRDIHKEIIVIGHGYTNWKNDEAYHLTEAEIKRNHEYLWRFAKEVENES